MAKKSEWNGKPAYEEGPLVLQLQDDGWVVIHAKTGWNIMGFKPFKQKKDAVRYAQNLIKKMELEFSSAEEMFALNGGKEKAEELRAEAFWEGKDE